jgi:hypothetical protein
MTYEHHAVLGASAVFAQIRRTNHQDNAVPRPQVASTLNFMES